MIRNNDLGRFKAGGNRVKMYLSRLKANPRDQGGSGVQNRPWEENSSDGLSLREQAHDQSWLLNR